MNWILDVIVLAILGLTVYFSVKNGFVKTALSMLSFALAVIAVVCLLSPVRSAMLDTGLAEKVTVETEALIENHIVDSKLQNGCSDLVAGKSEWFNGLISVVGIDRAELEEWYGAEVTGDETQRCSMLASRIAEPAVYALATLLAVVIIFVAARILLLIASRVLDGVARLPVLRSFNKLLGLLLGIVLALVRICLFCMAARVLMEHADFLGSDFLAGLDSQKTLLFGLFEKIDLFSFFF